MTSKKSKSSLPETHAKRQKLSKETKSPLATSQKRNVVRNKSKPCSTQCKSKTALPTNKTNKKLQSSRSEVEQKWKTGNVKVTKKSNGKNVPVKQKAVAKDMAASKRSTSTPRRSNNASKATKKTPPTSVRKTAARGTPAQRKTQKIVKSPARSQSAKRIKNEPVKKSLSKPGKKSVQAKKVDKTVKSKEKKPSKTPPSRNKLTVVSLKRTAQSIRTSGRNTKSDSKKDAACAAETTKKLSSTRRTNQKPSIALKQNTRIQNKKKSVSAQINVSKSVPRPRVKKEVKTKSPEGVEGQSLVHQTRQPVIDFDAVKNKTLEQAQSTSCCTSSVAEHALLKEKISSKSTTLSTRTSTVPLKRKRDSNKPLVKTAKKQKVSKQGSEKNIIDVPTEKDQKSKRISILDLCNEIAGEIESDTVEVVKEAPSTPNNPSEDEPIENKKDSPMEASLPPPSEHSPIMPSRRFFPSRKPLQMKSKVEQKTSPLTKKSKWNKIKLKKNFAPNNILRSRTVLPNLESIRAKASIQQTVMEALNTPKTSNKKPDATLSKDIKLNEPVLSERIKNNTVLSVEGESESRKQSTENGLLENHIKHELEMALDEGFRLHLDSSPENSPVKKAQVSSTPVTKASEKPCSDCKQLTDQMAASADRGNAVNSIVSSTKANHVPSDTHLQKEIRKLKEADKDSSSQPIIDAGQKRFGAITCNVCGMLYTASNPEDETQHLLFHNQFISAVKYVGWKKERIVAEYPDGKIIMVLPDDPKYALKKVEEIREMVDNDLGFQQVPLRLHSRTKTFLFINSDKKVVGCLIAEHIQWGYRVIEDNMPSDNCDKDQILSERVKAWCCSKAPEPAICGVSRIWVFSMMRRKKIASRMLECLRNHFIYGSHLSKDEIAFSDPTPDGKLFATHYCGTGQFLVYNFVSGHPLS
ncbi:N-acetyltransferase ESCO1 [Hyla sarda]|uniref:N-acetyltransferase ESCO1 n=1 Tax=Hyla sarda TaxID=327740 RepID=UPI0024C4389D|nr:N-acetyltransferase ESCO1 [Hyla sarda]XP_056377666.1 N-acetyltransferase ESCO1 [Hyla sarda]XP_056377667.1 N-acetyltransferase ESCO1 [Hyla sarda]